MVAEISRLRERLLMLESENASLSAKLNRQQWEVENRLAEIEMQICGAGSPVDSATDDNERNFESAIWNPFFPLANQVKANDKNNQRDHLFTMCYIYTSFWFIISRVSLCDVNNEDDGSISLLIFEKKETVFIHC